MVEPPRTTPLARHTLAVSRLPALACVSLAVVLSMTGCSDDEPAGPAAGPPTAPPSSPAPDRAFLEPTTATGLTEEDYRGRWLAGNRTILPCRTTLRVDVIDIGDGLAQVGSMRRDLAGRQAFAESVIFEDAEVVDGRWTGYIHDGALSQCTSAEVRMELDGKTGRIVFRDENGQSIGTGAALPERYVR